MVRCPRFGFLLFGLIAFLGFLILGRGALGEDSVRTEKVKKEIDENVSKEVINIKEAPKPLPTIDPKTPLKDLLPPAPAVKSEGLYLGQDLSRVPEVLFESAPAKELTTEQWQERKGRTIAAALHLNSGTEDGFLKALLRNRRDLAGAPFQMGGACRTKGLRRIAFKTSAEWIRNGGLAQNKFSEFLDSVDKQEGPERGKRERYLQAHIAALSQIMGGESVENRLTMVQHLASVSRVEATRELARLAVFAPEKSVREAAVEALTVRRERDYTDLLVGALRYPWPGVAENAARAIVKLERKDLLPKLIDVLADSDPRGPKVEEIDGKKTSVAQELVRINHHKSCLLCHAAADPEKTPDDVLVAEVPLPSEKLAPPEQGYNKSGSNLLVRIDVTYLRQNFSVMQAVEDSSAWPAIQRFDFIIRKRVLTEREAEALREKLTLREPGELSPYHRAAVRALRDMTGRDFEAKPEPWRKLLDREAKKGT
jgi:hypothetical protein